MKIILVNGYIKFLTHKVVSLQNNRVVVKDFYDVAKRDRYIAYLAEKELNIL